MSRHRRKKDKAQYGNGLSTWLPKPYEGPGRMVDPRLPVVYQPKPKETFDFECEQVTACSRAKAVRCEIAAELWFNLMLLAQRDKKEWLCYLLGEESAEGIKVTDVAFPNQIRSVASVEVTGDAPAGCVGKLHSHNTMQAFFSNTDKEHFNWPLEVVVNSKGEYEAVCRIKLPCGHLMHRDTKLMLVGSTIESWEKMLETVGAVEGEYHGTHETWIEDIGWVRGS